MVSLSGIPSHCTRNLSGKRLHLPRNNAIQRTLVAAGVILAVMMWAGCENTGSRGAYVARVNNAVLRESDLEIARDSLGEPAAASREYVNNWIVTEMLYQEAERRGITDAIAFQQQLDMTRKRLAVAALIQQEVYASVDSTDIPDEAIVQSYTASGPSFALREDLVHASVVLFRDREGANIFRSKVLRGASWDEALRQMRADSAQRLQIVRTASRQYYTRSRLYPDELWKLARSLPREEVSFPLRTPEGYTVVRVHQSFRQGEIPPLEYVRAEVREYLLMDLRRQRYEEFVGALRGRHSVDIRESSTDSGAILNKE